MPAPRGLVQLVRWLRWRWRAAWALGGVTEPMVAATPTASGWRSGEVWTERESGDWEACVATSYAMTLLYGGVSMGAPYTQAERERLEVVADEPQDLSTTDGQARAVYGAVLRGPSTTDRQAFLNRAGVGYCLTGVGSPLGYQPGTFLHEVMAVGRGDGSVAVYDPLAPAGYGPSTMSVSTLAGWLTGLGPNDAREIRSGEIGDEVNPNTQIPVATGRGFGPASVYANEQRSVKLFDLDSSEVMDPVGVYSWPASPTDAAGKVSLAAIRVDLIGAGGEDLRVGYLGIDRLTLHQPEPAPEPPPNGDYDTGYRDGQAAEAARWSGWLGARPVGELESWAATAPRDPASTRGAAESDASSRQGSTDNGPANGPAEPESGPF
jgi:hypothetical protein